MEGQFLKEELRGITSNAEEAGVEWSYEDLQNLLELTPKTDIPFILEGRNAKVGNQEIPGVTGKFGLGVQNEAEQRLIEFCQENALVILPEGWEVGSLGVGVGVAGRRMECCLKFSK